MSTEQELINIVARNMPKSHKQLNDLFESDAEIISFGDRKLLFNIDEFSQEDFLREHDPYTLGWNMALGAISDILATGGTPLYYLHSMVVSEDWDQKYIEYLSKGISALLRATGTGFIGGDMGKSNQWRYTATVIGEHKGIPLKRRGASTGDVIYITGQIGLGNLEAFLKIYSNKPFIGGITKSLKSVFTPRVEESRLISKYATACTDTSDGVYNGIKSICQMSKTGFMLKNIPYINSGVIAAKLASMPKTLLLLGECGEYELLFTLKEKDEEAFLIEAKEKNLRFYPIGNMCEQATNILFEGKYKTILKGMDISARSFSDMKQYINSLVNFLKDNTV